MVRDWLLTLLAVSFPYFVAMAIAVLVQSRRSAANRPALRVAGTSASRRPLARTAAASPHRETGLPQPLPRRLSYPLHKVVAAVDRAETVRIIAELAAAGFARDRIDVITAEEVQGLQEPVGGYGLHGLLTRLQLSVGDDLDELELVRRELVHGHALVQILVHGDGEVEQARTILGDHGGHAMRYFGRWAIRPLDNRPHRPATPDVRGGVPGGSRVTISPEIEADRSSA